MRSLLHLRRLCPSITRVIRYCNTTAQHRNDVLSSQFHTQGIRHFLKSKHLHRSSNSAVFDIDRLITELEKHRVRTAEVKERELIRDDMLLAGREDCVKYFQTYLKLIERVGDIKISEEWSYRIVGWYNLQPFLQLLIETLLEGADRTEQLALIESIAWMQPHQIRYSSEESIQELMKQKAKLDHFYRQLNLSLGVPLLQSIESIFGEATTQGKGKYYHNYLTSNAPSLLDESTPRTSQEEEHIMWLFGMYVTTYNDDPRLIKSFEEYFLRRESLNEQSINTLMKVYNMTGRINQAIYEKFIKSYLAAAPQNQIEVQIINLQFLIHSEVDDEQALNNTLKHIAKIARTQAISDGHRLHVHYLTHYLKVKNIKFAFPFQVFREFNEVCRVFEEDGTLAKTMAIELDEKSRREGVEYYNSSCVLKKKQFESTPKRSKEGEEIKKAEGFKKFSNVKFCCLNIELCVYEEQTRRAVILEKHYHRFQHSERLLRMEEVKATILRHYGFDINYLQTKRALSMKASERQQRVESSIAQNQ